jgi:hypothetical protein
MNVQQNNLSLWRFSSSLYCFFIKKTQTFDRLKMYLIKTLLYNTTHYKNDINMKMVVYKELSDYIKILIDNCEYETLSDELKPELTRTNWNKESAEFIFLFIIYIYYLSLKEKLANEKQKKCADQILREWKNEIGDVLFTVRFKFDSNFIDKEFIKNICSYIHRWEIFPKDEVKFCIIENVVNEFFLFFTLSDEYNIDVLIKKLEIIVKDNELMYYNIFAGKRKEITQQDYERYLELFHCREKNKENSIEAIAKFENALIKIYKFSAINQVKQSKPCAKMMEQFGITLKNNLISNIKKKIEILTTIEPEKTMYYFEQRELRINLPRFDNIIETEYIQKKIEAYFIKAIEHLIHKVVKYKEVHLNDENILNDFFMLVETSSDIDFDTIIGYRNWFYGMAREEDFKNFENKMKQIKSDRINDIILAINSKLFYFNLIDIEVRVDKLTEDEMLDSASITEEGKYLFNITNEIFLTCEKNELIEYLSNAWRKIVVYIKIEYGFTSIDPDSMIGVGVKIHR